MIETNKKTLGIAVVLLAAAMLAVPVMAQPTNGANKVGATLTMSNFNPGTGIVFVPNGVPTGPIIHTLFPAQTYDATIEIDDGPTLTGTMVIERLALLVPQPHKKDPGGGYKMIFTDHSVITITHEDGVPVGSPRGFEGNDKVVLEGATFGTAWPWEKGRSNALFQGTGAYEGQTLNFVRHWTEPAGPPLGIVWDGYLLKP